MSFEEKRVWIYAAVTAGVAAAYFAVILGRTTEAGLTAVPYAQPMLTAVGVAIAVNIAASIVAGIASPGDAGRKDERDTGIHLYGMRAEFYTLAVGAAAALVLTLAESDHFWIANTLYLTFVLSALASSIMKIIAYRRGF